MIIIKTIIFFGIIINSFIIGNLISNKYVQRVKELQEIKNGLNIFKNKAKFTYAPISDIFVEVSENLNTNIKELFKNSSDYMKILSADKAWIKAIDESSNNLKSSDKDVIKNLGKLLGKTDIDGQLSGIELTETFLDEQINNAKEEQEKNRKLYKTLGAVVGLVIVIILA